ncbi:MAG: ATP-binding cassette domain-containing protein [Candidatus Gastranaerophilales bacterium]|nr:ATP-binding cassette domain-containing protein [Candidatus Gastranaerophilales bacterium]
MLVQLKDIHKSYDDKAVLNGVSFNVEAGEGLAVVGFSGSGKSTVLKIISRLIEPDSGEIILGDDNIGMVFQYSALFDSLNIYENIAFALKERKELKKKYTEVQIREIVREKLTLVGLDNIEDKFPSELSGGMQKRVSFARAIVTNPRIILYDEPTAGLDPVSSTVIEDYIVQLKNELRTASIIVTHQMSTIKRTSDRVIMLYNGQIVWQGTPAEMLISNDPYARQFVLAQREGPMITAAG